ALIALLAEHPGAAVDVDEHGPALRHVLVVVDVGVEARALDLGELDAAPYRDGAMREVERPRDAPEGEGLRRADELLAEGLDHRGARGLLGEEPAAVEADQRDERADREPRADESVGGVERAEPDEEAEDEGLDDDLVRGELAGEP